nr:FCD domain-containing protein [Marinicella sp. W31]MDC2880101.1 FCD domain-containing protein [Marinicella sp. W31]
MRCEVEASAVTWAVANRTAKFEAKLETLLKRMEEAESTGQVREFIHRNYEFHFAIYAQAGSELLLEIISTLWLRINPQFHLLQRHGHYKASNRQHRALYERICAGDAEGAVKTLREDIDSAYEVILKTLEERGSPSDYMLTR